MQPGCICLISFVLYALVVRESLDQAFRLLVNVVYDFLLVIHVVCWLVIVLEIPLNSGLRSLSHVIVGPYTFVVDLLSHSFDSKRQNKRSDDQTTNSLHHRVI